MPSDRTPATYLELLRQIAERTDPLALARFRAHDLRVDTKRDQTLVTEADLAVESAAREWVARRHPELAVCGEEGGQDADRGAGRLWIDPIDSTQNFARGIPIFGTLLAVERDGEVIAGLVSAPALGTRWAAARGLGAERNGRPIRVSRVSELAGAQLFHGSLGGYEAPSPPPGYLALLGASKRQRGFGDFYQHVLVAEGAGAGRVAHGVAFGARGLERGVHDLVPVHAQHARHDHLAVAQVHAHRAAARRRALQHVARALVHPQRPASRARAASCRSPLLLTKLLP